jgi:hypothetical protein
LPVLGAVHERPAVCHLQRVHWGFSMLKRPQRESRFASSGLPLNLGSILLVGTDAALRNTRGLLLSALHHPVLVVGGYAEVCRLPSDSNRYFMAIDLTPSEHKAARIAIRIRPTLPNAKIPLLGRPSDHFDDPLYDDAVDSCFNPSHFVEAARLLLTRSHLVL